MNSFNSVVKKSLNYLCGFLGAQILTRSDHSKNGLKPYMVEFFMRQSSGILHIGAHEGQEANFYDSLQIPVVWVEANPEIFTSLVTNLKKYPNQSAVNYLLAADDQQGRDFFTTNNGGHSSSMFPLSPGHAWTGLVNTDTFKLDTSRLDSKFSSNDLGDLDFWIIDTQGAELEVLIGAGQLLVNCCKYLLVEISQGDFYQGGAAYKDIREFLAERNFVPIYSPSHPHEEVMFLNLSKFLSHPTN